MSRRIVVRHLLAAVALCLVVAGLVVLGAWRLAVSDAHRDAEASARRVATAVLAPLAGQDFGRPDRGRVLDHIEPFLAAGTVQRVKVLTVDGGTSTVVFSDEPRVEGRPGRLDPDLAERLATRKVTVGAVPDDNEHRYENGLPGTRLEVFFPFRDAAGAEVYLELYLPVDVSGTARHTTLVLLPVVLAGLTLVLAGTMPVSMVAAGRAERLLAAHRHGLAAADGARREAARQLHDDVIPNLAAASLLLQQARARPGDEHTLSRAADAVTGGLRRLRGVLADVVPAGTDDRVGPVGGGGLAAVGGDGLAAVGGDGLAAVGGDLGSALRTLAERMRDGEVAGPVAVAVTVTGPDSTVAAAGTADAATAATAATAAAVRQIAGELLRNTFRHADASTVEVTVVASGSSVTLTVADDGAGFDPRRAARPGHVGLALVRQTARERGGRLTIVSTPGAGTTVTVSLPT
ncbi:sensor histidine kinase [Virgisporangium aurantiacum]|uniref:histidine kinase n=1 Tax=Virgisporangium aurantiacum TaxID=175570 RepID=A0A8J4DY78_9ACTN|nr:ATP-binding protein [Virgisporangium aurantiacum]GIJ54163.1 hypothetical protein Vau01_016790 [Virgisporangium aurantiacum]